MYHSRIKLEANAICPFYKCEFKRTITCEGVEDGIENVMRFSCEDRKIEYATANCMQYPNCCRLAKELEDKYEG